MRTAVLALLTAAMAVPANHVAYGQTRSTTCDWYRTLQDQPTFDGQNYTVGYISNPRITVIEETNNVNVISTNFQFDFNYENGFGAYGGSQTMFIDLKNANGIVLETVEVRVPRSRCYHSPTPFMTRVSLARNYCNLYKAGGSAELRINRVTGKQWSCD